MPSPFETLQTHVFDAVKSTFGFNASYVSADSTVTWEGIVLFMNPSQAMEHAGIRIEPNRYIAEYFDADLPRLRERVHARLTREQMTVDGQVYDVTAVDDLHDGKTQRAHLIPVNS